MGFVSGKGRMVQIMHCCLRAGAGCSRSNQKSAYLVQHLTYKQRLAYRRLPTSQEPFTVSAIHTPFGGSNIQSVLEPHDLICVVRRGIH